MCAHKNTVYDKLSYLHGVGDLKTAEGGSVKLYLATILGCDVTELVVQCASGSCRHHIWLNVNLALKSVSRCVRRYKVNFNIDLSLLLLLSFC